MVILETPQVLKLICFACSQLAIYHRDGCRQLQPICKNAVVQGSFPYINQFHCQTVDNKTGKSQVKEAISPPLASWTIVLQARAIFSSVKKAMDSLQLANKFND